MYKGNPGDIPPLLAFERVSSFPFDRVYSPAFADMVLTHREDAVPNKAEDCTSEAIALYPANTPEEGYYFYIPMTKDVVKRATFTVCEVYTESIIQALLRQYSEEMTAAAKLQRPSYDIEPLSTLSLDTAITKRTATVATTQEMPFTGPRKDGYADSFAFNEDFLATCAAAADFEIMAASTASYTLRNGLMRYGLKAKKAILGELQGILDRHVWDPRHDHELTRKQQRRPLHEKWVITEKKTPEGVFEKIKARMVVLGNLQTDEQLTSSTRSPTPSFHTIFVQATIAAATGRHVFTFDVGQAFLNAQLRTQGCEDVILQLSKRTADILLEIDPSYKEFLRKDGTMRVKLNKALYGLREAPRIWFDTIKAFFIMHRFKQSTLDECLFYKKYSDKTSIDVLLHVDDGKGTTDTPERARHLLKALKQQFKVLKVNQGNKHNYLSMVFEYNREDNTVNITMPTYAKKIVDSYETRERGNPLTPHTPTLFKIQESTKLNSEDQGKFHSTVMRIMYYAQRVRPDILCTVNFLSTRTRLGTTTLEDKDKLIRLVQFINSTHKDGITLGTDSSSEMRIFAYADAAYGVHMDSKSHTGLVITFGRGPIYVKSCKQKCVTKSSCEVEIIALSDIVATVAWMNDLLVELLGSTLPPVLMEDNKAAIQLVTNGASTADRSRHVHIRNNFVFQFLDSGKMEIRHCPTDKMLADLLTKPLNTDTFFILREFLLGNKTAEQG